MSDLAMVAGGRAAVLRGKADGTFDGALHYDVVPHRVVSTAIADLNGDQVDDLALAIKTPAEIVMVFLGTREGTFSPPADYRAGVTGWSTAIGDLNGDQALDMVLAGDGAVSVLLGLGDGSFANYVKYPFGLAGPVSVAIGDVNGDQIPDLATLFDGIHLIAVMLGLGDGTFSAPAFHSLFDAPNWGADSYSLAMGDLNGDEVADLVAITGRVFVLLGVGDGTFTPWADHGAGVVPVFVSIGDLNNDQVPDLAVANAGDYPIEGGVSVLLGVGDGTFSDPVNYAPGYPTSVAIGDLDGDQVPDLLAANTVLLGVGDGTFPPAVQLNVGGKIVAIGDMDGDRAPDVVVAGSGSFTLLLNQSSGACCIGNACDGVPHADCLDSGGTYFGHNTTCDQSDSDGDGLPNTCDGCDNNTEDCNFVSPILAAPPHGIRKNRYISIDARGADQSNIGRNFDIRVTLSSTLVNGVTAVGSDWWAGAPDANCISLVGSNQPATPPNWDACPTLHLTGCPIIPTSTYEILAVAFGLQSSPPLVADTQARPGDKWHGDSVGTFTGPEGVPPNVWTAPNETTNADDFVAAIKTFQDINALNATHVSVSDMEPNQNGTQINLIVNINDVFSIIRGFQGFEYPGTAIELCP